MNDGVALPQWRERQHVRRKLGGEMSRKLLRQRFSLQRTKSRGDKSGVDPEMLGA